MTDPGDRRSRYLMQVVHKPRVALALTAACSIAWFASLSGWTVPRAALLTALCVYPLVLRALNELPPLRRAPLLGLVPDWIAAGLCVACTGLSVSWGLTFTLAVVMPAIVLGGLLWGSVALCTVASIALVGWNPGPPPGPSLETLGQLALVGCLAVVSIAIYEHQQGVLQRVHRARDRADSAVSLANRLSRYVAPTVFAAIRTSPFDNNLSATNRELTVFFSDIEGFTEMTERLPVGLVTRLLNEYLDLVNAMADKHGGVVDKFMGDGVLIFFDDSRRRGTSGEARACICMAIEMREELALLRDIWRNEGTGVDLHVRMGIHTGICRVGNFGSPARMDYTVIGAPVNLASRLEGAARSDQILISAATRAHLGRSVHLTTQGMLSLKGIRHPVAVFEVIGTADKDTRESESQEREAAEYAEAANPHVVHEPRRQIDAQAPAGPEQSTPTLPQPLPPVRPKRPPRRAPRRRPGDARDLRCVV